MVSSPQSTHLIDSAAIQQALTQTQNPLEPFRSALKQANQTLKDAFLSGTSATELVYQRAGLIDQLLCLAWQHCFRQQTTDRIALIAVGGYGRGELHPGSDIDLLILLKGDQHQLYKESIERFLYLLWDIGLEVGHSVRSLKECVHEAARDITVATNLMEARQLTGPQSLFNTMRERTGPDRIWPSKAFFQAKLEEQQQRHRKFDDTAYNLEPNIKEGPGGLRDLQVIGWVAKRHFGADSLHELIEHSFLNENEYQELITYQNFLWRIRMGLHLLTGRREDRLLFDHQRTLARQFGYQDTEGKLAVEQFMKDYYRTIMELGRLNEMLLQLFEEAILYRQQSSKPVIINGRFQAHKGFVEVRDTNCFKRSPYALLEIFLVLQQNPELKGVRAETIRLIRSHRYLIDDKFRNDLACRSLFMEILRQPTGLTHVLRRMHAYGILGRYLPLFGEIEGQMQHDLFHVYTVDEHIVFVVRNLRRLTVPEFQHEFPLCSAIIQQVPKPELLYLAALFHDIAKGRGGDHSNLGANDARLFCRHHGLSEYDTEVVAWLVDKHLIMSSTSQRKDLSDPQVINDFAHQVGQKTRLDYLYLLTVADIRATSPTVWNAWKEALLNELYHATKAALARGLENPLLLQEQIEQTRDEVMRLLAGNDEDLMPIANHLARMNQDYMLRYSPLEIVRHLQAISNLTAAQLPLIQLHNTPERGGTEVFVHSPINDQLFAIVTYTLDQLGLTIVDARIISSNDGLAFDTYMILESDGSPITAGFRQHEIEQRLYQNISRLVPVTTNVRQHLPRQIKQFPIPTQVEFGEDQRTGRTVMEVISTDRPGLLSRIGMALNECGARLHNARVSTFGARAEDIFYITDRQNRALQDDAQRQCLRDRIREYLAL